MDRWGNPPVRYNLFYFDHVYMIGGMTRLGGLPGLPGRVVRSILLVYFIDFPNYSV